MILRIERYSIHDGPGIRTTVFLKGCPLRCLWCHTPESQSPLAEAMPRPERCLHCLACLPACEHGALAERDGRIETDRALCEACGRCVESCPSGARDLAGRSMTAGDVIDELRRDRIFYEESGGGVTFSGGEPLMQPGFLLAMLRRCRSERIHAAVDTSGCAGAETVRAAGRLSDLILYDLKLMDSGRHRRFTGAPNERILENLALLAGDGRPVIVRVPLIPGVNDDEANIRATGAFVASLGLRRVDLLPYHRAGTARYERLARPYALAGIVPPAPEEVARAIRCLEAHGLDARAGGS